MPADLNRLTEGWLELESDPGLFTLLLEDFGVRGVQVEEVYDLQKSIEGVNNITMKDMPTRCRFLEEVKNTSGVQFEWIEERRSRRKLTAEESFVEDEGTINSIFFAQQMVPNSCATHALLSVLLNCPKIFLGPTLMRLKEHTANMSPENKGYAIGNTPELARAHNSHAKPEPRHLHEKSHGITTGRTIETFHFVSYVPISGRLFELDGLKPYPIDHGPCSEEDWTEKFRRVMTERLGTATGGEPYHDVRFNLMAVVPDRRIAYEQKLRTLKTNRQIVLEALQQLVKLTHPELTSDDHAAYIAAMNKQRSESMEDDIVQELGTPKAKDNNSGDAYPKLPPALDSHNYAKSPLMEGLKSGHSGKQPHYEDYSGSEYSDEDSEMKKQSKTESETEEMKSATQDSVDIAIKVTDQSSDPPQPRLENSSRNSLVPLTINTSSDLLKPLSIQTKFQPSPTPSACSTDTSSEVGSAFNSPVQAHYNFAQSSPNSTTGGRQSERAAFEDAHDIKKFVVIRVTSGKDTDSDAYVIGKCNSLDKESDKRSKAEEPPKKRACIEEKLSIGGAKAQENADKGAKKCDPKNIGIEDLDKSDPSKHLQLSEPHKFAPKDLLALLKTVETEITICETNLHDEVEKRKKYKIDDCRRTHNYDQFICTFLSMLAEQGKLADLVEQQLIVHKRQGVSVGRLHRTKKPEKRRRSRPKKRK